ncbi:glutamine amidotransferase [Microbacteriaceae bacterium K1510]|nr:glutamine amidotransferase [Microbacteriaceae bacterium K1510]
MPREKPLAIAIRHVAFEDLGLLAPILDDLNWEVAYCDAATDDLTDRSIDKADLLIVLGGPIGVYESDSYPFLTREIRLIERRLKEDRATLGICLGSQLMARALGARVFPGHAKEIGWASVQLTHEGRQSCLRPLAEEGAKVLHWHGDTFDLPDQAVLLASNTLYANQAFSFGARALALQFHAEVDQRHLEEWFVGHAVELSTNGISVRDLRQSTALAAKEARARSARIFSDWLRPLSAMRAAESTASIGA